MRLMHLSFGLPLFLALACQDNSGSGDDWGPIATDAQHLGDARAPCSAQTRSLALSCNPVTQAGCAFGEKCAMLVESESPFLSRTACVPEGHALPGEACVRGPAGACAGFDDCIAGFHCAQGTCARICDVGPPDGCREEFEPFGTGEYCTLFEGVFWDNVGVCVNACNPTNDQVADGGQVINTDCDGDENCVPDPTREAAVCLPPSATGL